MSLVGGDVQRQADADESYVTEVGEEVRDARGRLLNWYRMNPAFETGSLTVLGRDEYRPGDKVFLPWAHPPAGDEKGMYFYCSAVQWSWTVGQPYTTTMKIERGHNAGSVMAFKIEVVASAPYSNISNLAET